MSGKLGAPFVLCTTQNQSKLQGLEAFDDDCVLATFDKVVTKYKVNDQKPLSSWNMKEGFKCPAVYDSNNEKYVAVTKNNQIISWTEDSSSLEKFKKSLIKSPILRLCNVEGVVNVVYQNGAILPLGDTIENKKSDVPGVIDAKITEVFICRRGLNRVAVFFSLDTSEFWAISDGKIFTQGTLKNGKFQLRGIGFDVSSASLLSYWSNQELHSYHVFGGDKTPGTNLGKIETFNGSNSVKIIPMESDRLIIFGRAADGSGKCIVYNKKFRIIQEERKLKSAEKSPLIFGPFSSHIFLASDGQVVAYPLPQNQIHLDDMLGSSSVNDENVLEVLDWDDSPADSPEICYPESVQQNLEELLQKGLPESRISEIVMEPLMKKKDVASITLLLESMNKVSETTLAKLVSFCLRGEDRDFSNNNADAEDLSASLPPEFPLRGGRKKLLNLILSKSFTTSKLLVEAREHISPQDAILFIQHSATQLWDGETPATDTESQFYHLVNWVSVLLDAHYQYCLLTCDQQVASVLNALLVVIDMEMAQTNELSKLKPVLELLIKQHSHPKSTPVLKRTVFPKTDPRLLA